MSQVLMEAMDESDRYCGLNANHHWIGNHMSTFIGQNLTDIDSMALVVRDPESKRLINEAISAYRGGALRSAIISTWIAVDYDIIVKARELSANGDASASTLVLQVDKAIKDQDKKLSQVIESTLLAVAHNELQLFAPHEHEDLSRLQKDRHLCAHPAFTTEETLFQPTPELVRTHIVHALKHLLINAPLQGKSAIERFHTDLLSPSFPVDPNNIGIFIREKYLNRAKDVMVINLVKSLLSAPFGTESDKYIGQKHQIARTLREISIAKQALYDSAARDHIARKFENIPDDLLLSVSSFLECDQRIWEWMTEPTRIRFRTLLQDANAEALKAHSAFDTFSIPELAEIISTRFDSFDQEVQIGIISQNPIREFITPAIRIYGDSRGFRTAEIRGRSLIIPLAQLMSAGDIQAMLDVVKNNDQIYDASDTANILESVFDLSLSVISDAKQYWQEFVDKMTQINGDNPNAYYSYPKLREKIKTL